MNDNIKNLKHISPDDIEPNPENPRLFFRQDELNNLMISISNIGIQVPVSVYKDGDKYYLLDGERRWRCSKKLNLKKIPALIQEKPSELDNLLLMYNIHALREQWDFYTIASKLQRIIELFRIKNGQEPKEKDLIHATGLTQGQIRRCKLLLDLPSRFHEMLHEELQLPKSKQKISEDFFIEMEKSLKTIVIRFSDFENDIDDIRDTLINKYKDGTINAVTDFRQLAKIATSVQNLDLDEVVIKKTLSEIFTPDNSINIKDKYKETVEFEYDELKALRQLSFLNDYMEEVVEDKQIEQLDEEFIDELRELYGQLRNIFEGQS